MKYSIQFLPRSLAALALAAAFVPAIAAFAGPPEKARQPAPEVPPPVHIGAPPARSGDVFVYDQKPSSGRPVLISPEQAKSIIDRFKAAYPQMGSPRIVIAVNRELVDEASGLKLAGRAEKSSSSTTDIRTDFKADASAPAPAAPPVPNAENVTIIGDVGGLNRPVPGSGSTTARTEKTSREQNFRLNEKNQPTLADKQTARDVERLFGRPLRMGGAKLADQKAATQLLGPAPADTSGAEGEQARKDREALAKIADVALEVLVSSRQVTVSELSGDRAYNIPDIQATAIRLRDSQILGQASSSDIIGQDRYAGNFARNFDVRQISEATALALMEDILLSTGQ